MEAQVRFTYIHIYMWMATSVQPESTEGSFIFPQKDTALLRISPKFLPPQKQKKP